MTTLAVHFEEGPAQVFSRGTDPARQYCRVRHDFELAYFNFKSRLEGPPWYYPLLPARKELSGGMPETCKLLYGDDRISMTPPRARWLYGLCCWSAGVPAYDADGRPYLDALNQWMKLTDSDVCFTNDAGWDDGFFDPISGVNAGNEPMRWARIATGGAVFEVIGPKFIKQRVEWYPIRCLDPDNLLPYGHPDLEDVVFRPTIIRREATPDGGRKVIPFGQFWTQALVPLWVPGGVGYIEVSRVDLLPRGAPKPRPLYG